MEQLHNGVSYDQEKDYCLVRERDQKRHFPVNKRPITSQFNGLMPNQSMVTLSMANEYIDPWNSYITFDVEGAGNSVSGMVLSGGWISLIENVVLMDRYGKEIERCDRMNRLNQTMLRGVFGDEFMKTVGGVQPLDKPIDSALFGNANATSGSFENVTTNRVFIPLPMLLGLFRTSQLLPPHLMDGMQVWIYWSNSLEVFTQVLNSEAPILFTPPGVSNIPDNNLRPYYTISNLQLTTDIYLLDHGLHEYLTQEYNQKGLPLKFMSWGHDQTFDTERDVDKEVRLVTNIKKSYSQATKVLTHARISPDPTTGVGHVAGPVFVNNILNNLKMLYNETAEQRFIKPTKDWIHKNGRTFPLFPTDQLDQLIYYWKQATGKNKFYTDSFSSDLVDDWVTNNINAPSFLKQLARSPNVMPNVSTGLPGESSKSVSGVRVDGESPMDMFYEFPVYDDAAVTQLNHHAVDVVELVTATEMKRTIDIWVEHIRYVNIRPQGNSVLI